MSAGAGSMARPPLSPAALGIAVAGTYVVFALLALTRYPEPFSPTTNWLSDLGNTTANPGGAGFYNAGMIITGALLILFFVSLGALRLAQVRAQVLILLVARLIGVIGALSMVMTAVFPINRGSAHSFWSAVLYISLGTAFGLTVAALRYHRDVHKWLLVYGGVTTLTDLVVSVFFNTIALLEWPTVALFLSYCALLGFETARLSGMPARR